MPPKLLHLQYLTQISRLLGQDGKLKIFSFGAQENHRSAFFEVDFQSLVSADGTPIGTAAHTALGRRAAAPLSGGRPWLAWLAR